MKHSLILISIIVLCLSACENPTDIENNYRTERDTIIVDYPLQQGNNWNYKTVVYDTVPGQILSIQENLIIEFSDSVIVDGITKYKYHPFLDSRPYAHVYLKDDGLYFAMESDAEGSYEAKVLDKIITKGSKFEGHIGYCSYFWGVNPYIKEFTTYDLGELEVISLDTSITVSAGTFSCFQVQHQWQHDSFDTPFIINRFYSTEVGLVLEKETIYNTKTNLTQKSYTQELISYQVK